MLGTALTIKMLAYVGLSPVINALVARWPKKPVLIGADLIRAAMALCMPFITDVWQIYVVTFLLQSASATFTPAFQSLIPTILTDEKDYTRALSLSLLAYDMEALVRPAAAALLLIALSYKWLGMGNKRQVGATSQLRLLEGRPCLHPGARALSSQIRADPAPLIRFRLSNRSGGRSPDSLADIIPGPAPELDTAS